MRITYDKSVNMAYIYVKDPIPPGAAVTQKIVEEELGDYFMLDLDDQGQLLGIEVSHASTRRPPEVLAAAEANDKDLDVLDDLLEGGRLLREVADALQERFPGPCEFLRQRAREPATEAEAREAIFSKLGRPSLAHLSATLRARAYGVKSDV